MAIVVGYVATKEGRAALKRAAEECVLRGTKLVVISSHRGGRDFDADEAARFESELERIKGLLEERGLEHEVRQLVRGNEPADGSLGLLDMTPYGRREGWEDNPEGWPEAPQAGSPVGGHGSPICWYWRSDADGVASWGPTSRPVPQWTRPGATPVETLGRRGNHH